MEIPIQKDKIAIVIVGYNRLSSTQRLLSSLINAKYPKEEIPLVFCIDAGDNQELYNWVESVYWPHGNKYVIIQQERLGLRKHIYVCGDLTYYFKGVIILEDDIFVSPDFYMYTCSAVEFYYHENSIAGIALFADQTNGYAQGLPNFRFKDGSEAYLLQEVCTSGECFTDKMWQGFRQWLKENEEKDPQSYYMPNSIKNWKNSWSKYYNMYILDRVYYFLTPYLSRTTNCGDVGVHSNIDLNYLHAEMLWGIKKEYHFNTVDRSIKYDIFGDYVGLGQFLGILEEDLCVDFYGNKPHRLSQRYILSPYRLPYEVVQSYGLTIEPIEANIIHGLHGLDLFLYDTVVRTKDRRSKNLTLHQLSYFMRGTSYRVQLRYSLLTIMSLVKSKLRRLIKKIDG